MRRLAFAVAVLLAVASGAAAQKGKGQGAVLPGGNSGKPVNIEAVKLDYFDKEQKLIYTGSVVATQGDAKLKASVLTIFLAPKSASAAAASSNQVQRMVAAGPVTMLQRDQVGTGDGAVYDRATNSVVLSGNVTLSQGPNVTKGDRLTYDLKTGQAVVTGRVKSMFLPGSNAPAAPNDDTSEEAPTHKRGRGATAAAGPKGT